MCAIELKCCPNGICGHVVLVRDSRYIVLSGAQGIDQNPHGVAITRKPRILDTGFARMRFNVSGNERIILEPLRPRSRSNRRLGHLHLISVKEIDLTNPAGFYHSRHPIRRRDVTTPVFIPTRFRPPKKRACSISTRREASSLMMPNVPHVRSTRHGGSLSDQC
jgi:hypothetical protein